MKELPSLPAAVPSRGGALSRRGWGLLLRLLGWKIRGVLPDLPRFVLIGAPHTSNWDFVIALSLLGALGVRVTWLAKHTLFRWPFGPVMRYLGGIPVDRREAGGFVNQATASLLSADRLIIGLMPEGTRKRTDRWKTGFYHIAVGAGVPIVPVYLDYRSRCTGIGTPMVPVGDLESDLKKLKAFYRPYARSGRRPDRYGSGEDA